MSLWARCPHHLACLVEELVRDGAEDVRFRGGAAKFGLISITYHKYILGVYKYILRLEISIFDRKNR